MSNYTGMKSPSNREMGSFKAIPFTFRMRRTISKVFEVLILITYFWMEAKMFFFGIIIVVIINHNVYILSQVIKTKETSIVVRDLQPLTKYEVLLTVHTMGGSLNGSVVALATGQIGGFLFLI